MKHIKLFENYNDIDIHDLAQEVDSILVDIKDNGLEVQIIPMSDNYLYISIIDPNEETFWFNSIIYNRLLFLSEYLNEKYSNISIKVSDTFMEATEFPFDIECFSDEIEMVEVQIKF